MAAPWGRLKANFCLSDEEMGKKDDDHPTTSLRGPKLAGTWQPATRVPSRRLVKRLLVLTTIAGVVWFLFKTPSTGSTHGELRSTSPRTGENSPVAPASIVGLGPSAPDDPSSTAVAPDVGPVAQPAETRYNGPVRFLELGDTLRTPSPPRGTLSNNKNVVFAAASLKTAATLLPLACQMSLEERSYVHFALMSRSEISLVDLRELNGIDPSCEIIFHDARPNFASMSTSQRLEHSVTRALYHFNIYKQPKAVIIDSSAAEEDYFVKGMRRMAPELRLTLIELPENPGKRLSWLTKLDSASLKMWNSVQLDVLIHAPLVGSGSLIRLLKSLRAADLASFPIPHLTIELPSQLEPATEKFLEGFEWPAPGVSNPTRSQMLTVRRRIPRQRLSEEDSSVRFLENFWPIHPATSHVLVLSPQAELSPSFFHYLKFVLLEHHYANAASMQQDISSRLMGISFDTPSKYVNDTDGFKLPVSPAVGEVRDDRGPSLSPFLWQSPNSNAMLFTGAKWVELHGFLSELLNRQHFSAFPPTALNNKLVSKRYPSWLEYALLLSRLRGYFTLYPSSNAASAIMALHSDLNHYPEEYVRDSGPGSDTKPAPRSLDIPNERFSPGTPFDILGALPERGGITPLSEMPLLSWDGNTVDFSGAESEAFGFMSQFRREMGCEDGEVTSRRIDSYARDLFCTTA